MDAKELKREVVIDGQRLAFVDVVAHISSDAHIVLCHDASDELRYMSLEEWNEAQQSSCLSGESAGQARGNSVPAGPLKDVDTRSMPTVTQASSDEDKVAFIMSLFKGRSDVYAEGYVGKTTKQGKLSYWPLCRSRWKRGVCPRLSNRGARCANCDHPDYAPLTSEVVASHCKGIRDKRNRIQSIGIYVVDGSVCYLLVADFDGPGWQEAAAAYRDACRCHDLEPAVERSRSGNGAHVWVFFDGPVEASVARRVGEGLISEARDVCSAVSFRSYDRLFPLQDVVGPGNLGSLIALPLQGEAVRRGNSVFLDDRFDSFPDQCAYLSTLKRASTNHICELADEFGSDPIGLPQPTSRRLAITMTSAPQRKDAVQNGEPSTNPSTVRVALANGIRIQRDGLPASLVNRLRRLAAFRNPEYSKKLAMHFSVWEIPRLIDLSTIEDGELILPRGCTEGAQAVLREAGVKPQIVDGRTRGRAIHARFMGELRSSQELCLNRLVAHDLGVLVAPTGFGKSVIAASVIAHYQVSTLVIVPSTSLLKQWRTSLAKFLAIDDKPPILLTPTGRKRKRQPGVVGVIGGGDNLRSGLVDVALAGSLFEKGEAAGDMAVSSFVSEYGMVIVDEAQHVAATKVLEVMRAVRARYVYAMTATPKRNDRLDRILFLECGPLRHEVAVADQIAEQGMRRLLVPRFSTTRPDLRISTTWHDLMDFICVDESRNHLVVSDVMRALHAGRTPLVLTRRVEHARLLAKLVTERAGGLEIQVTLLVGSDDATVRRQRLVELQKASDRRPLCVVATGPYVGEGFDLDRLDVLFLAGPVAFDGMLAQWVGRLHRVREGKKNVVVLDYVDPAIPMFDNEWRKRLGAYRKMGYVTAGEEDLALVGLAGQSSPVGHLFAGNDYLEAVERDLAECQESVHIASSWVRYSRVQSLIPVLESVHEKGVVAHVVLKEPSRITQEWERVLAVLHDMNCMVDLVNGGAVALDYVVIDQSLVWYGGVASLGYPKKTDCSLRLVNREVAAALIESAGQVS